MSILPAIHDIFGRFQNLNLLALLHDLKRGQTARSAWISGKSLCPIAHGLAGHQDVRQLCVLGQSADLEKGCEYAARRLGADPGTIYRFVCSWDENVLGQKWLHEQLQALWRERLEDAEAMQKVLEYPSVVGFLSGGA